MSDVAKLYKSDIPRTFGPVHCNMYIPDPYTHKAIIPEDDGGPITFRWHFQRGLLQPRMSALELCEFILKHMPAIIPLLNSHPRVQKEFQAMLIMLVTTPKKVIDRLLPWIRSITKGEDDDVIYMSLYDKTEQPSGPLYFVLN